MNEIVISIANHCLQVLALDNVTNNRNYYKSMPLCVIDSVFSINAKYTSVQNTIFFLGQYLNIETLHNIENEIPSIENQLNTSYFVNLFTNHSPQHLANTFFNNRRRTSPRNGILKADAVLQFLIILKNHEIETFQDIQEINKNDNIKLNLIENDVKNIPGQRSGISFKYFLMLTGDENMVKPDRMIYRFINEATNNNFQFTNDQIIEIIRLTVTYLNTNNDLNLTPRLLDKLIWMYQRGQ